MKDLKSKKIITAVLALLLCLAIAGLGITLHARNAERQAGQETADVQTGADGGGEQNPGQGTGEENTSEPSEILFFASDYQAESGWPEPSATLEGILSQVRASGKTPGNYIFCGDYTNDSKLHDYQLSPDESIEEIRSVVKSVYAEASEEDMIFVQGNHDRMTDMISGSGLHEFDNYLIYVLNTESDFPWKQGRDAAFRDKIIRAADEMKACFDQLTEKGETRPVIIAGHVPLHYTARTSSRHTTGDNLYSSYIFDVVNEAAKSLDIIYLTGHNHSKGWDCYLGGGSLFRTQGDTLLIPDAEAAFSNGRAMCTDDYTEEILNFTYMNAGYIGYYMNCGPEELNNGTLDQYEAADASLTGTVCEIYPDKMVMTRYAADGIHDLGSKGEGDPYKGGIDAELIDSSHYSTSVSSPQTIVRKQ